MSKQSCWAADPHQYGPGKIHIVDTDDADRTMCGKWLRAVPGKLTQAGKATCKICLNAIETRAYRNTQREEYAQVAEQRALERQAESREWFQKYNEYLRSPSWRRRHEKVMKRANGVCEACLERKASHVHHLHYDHLFNEPLFDLRAICGSCHELITKLDRERRAAR